MTSSELADAVGESQESASRKLQQLRSLGIADYRRESKNTINFLTPAARQAYAVMSESRAAPNERMPLAVTGHHPRRAFSGREVRRQNLEDVIEADASISAQVIASAEADAIHVGDLLGDVKRRLPSHLRCSQTFALYR
jgi:DNA-binding transcriptional ArsR family regulator